MSFHREDSLTAEAVESSSLAFERVDDVHGSHCFPLGVLSVGHGVSDNVLEEDLKQKRDGVTSLKVFRVRV